MQYKSFDEHELSTFVEGIVAATVEKTINKLTTTPDVMSKQQLAAYWQVSKGTIDRYMAEHGLPFRKIAGGSPRFFKRECDAWMSRRGE
jgi:excisionase family DNA binding protein